MIGVPALMTSEEVAHEMGYADRSSVHRRISCGDVRLAACRLPGTSFRSWSRARLEAAGYLCPAVAPVLVQAPLVTPAPAYVITTWRVA